MTILTQTVGATLPPALSALNDWRQFILWEIQPPRVAPDGKEYSAAALRKAGWSRAQMEALPIGPGKPAKVPLSPVTFEPANPHDSATWLSHGVASSQARLLNLGEAGPYGAGFVLTGADPFFCLDIDGAATDGGEWSPIVQELISQLPGCAVEISVSGTGLHLWGTYSGPAPVHQCKDISRGIELYTALRFIALGLPQANGSAATDCTQALAAVIGRYFAPGGVPGAADGVPGDWRAQWASAIEAGPVADCTPIPDDTALIGKARAARSGAVFDDSKATFSQLYDADADALAEVWPGDSGNGYDASSADYSLAVRLAFWTGKDAARIDRLMRASALMRDKWSDRDDYLPRTILGALQAQGSIYQGKGAATPVNDATAAPGDAGGVFGADAQSVLAAVSAVSGAYASPFPYKDHNACYHALAATGVEVRSNTRRRAQVEVNERGAGWKRITDGRTLNLRDRMANAHWYATATRGASPLKFGKDQFLEHLTSFGFAARVDPFRHWLENDIPAWDETPRLDGWLCELFTLADGASELNQWAARFIFLGAVQRTMTPGCKLDEMPVLLGPQNCGKSTALRAMLPEDNKAGLVGLFSDGLHLAADSKTRAEALEGRVLVEASEMSGSTRAELESLKAFLSRTDDGDHRKAYGRSPEPSPRMAIIVGTSNDMAVLPNDPTGNRRFVVVRITNSKMAAETFMGRYAVQLWAEAITRYRTGERANLPRQLSRIQSELNREYRRADMLEDLIAQRNDLTGKTLADIGTALGLGGSSMKLSDQKRLAAALRQNGYERARIRQSGKLVYVWTQRAGGY